MVNNNPLIRPAISWGSHVALGLGTLRFPCDLKELLNLEYFDFGQDANGKK